jgi:hypothetical protein
LNELEEDLRIFRTSGMPNGWSGLDIAANYLSGLGRNLFLEQTCTGSLPDPDLQKSELRALSP